MTDDPFLQRTFHAEGVEYMKLCFDFTAYWVGSAFERAAGIVHFYRRSLALLGPGVRFHETDTSGGARPVDADALELLPFWLTGTRSRRSIYILSLESGAAPNLPSDRAFLLRAWEATEPPVGCVRVVLPARFADDAGEAAVSVFADLVSGLRHHSGHAGFSVNWNETGDYGVYAQRTMGTLARRHPGLDLPDTTAALAGIAHGFKRVSWLTLLGARDCRRLGGITALRAALGPDVIVHALPDGAIIQAGPRPEVGDLNRDRWLPLYHRVGTVLERLRGRAYPGFIARERRLGDDDATDEWLAHFDSWPAEREAPWAASPDAWRTPNENEETT